ncbi:MAG: hypothetical protein ACFFCI_13440 [Promethearchaeota archaeon]
MDGKVNSASGFNENSFEKIKENQERLVLAKLLSPSMNPLFKIGDNVPVRIKSVRTQFQKGDIVAFERDGVIVLHQIIDSYMYKGETYYVTGGLNPDTNPYVDSTTISRNAIIGKADLSEQALVEIQELAKIGRLPYFEVYGMPSYTINSRYQIDQTDISNFESNNFYDYLKINLLIDDISKIFVSDSDHFIEKLFQEKEFLKNVFNDKVMKIQFKNKLPNILEELFYSIYIMNPDNSLDSTFNKISKRKALETIKNYLLSNGYDINNLGLDEKELFVDYYNEYMQIIDNSLKIEINGKPSKISSRSLDPIKARIWYKVQEYNFFEFINEKFDISIDPNNIENLDLNDRNKVACYLYSLRNIFRVKSRNLINDFKNTEDFMRSEACNTRKEIFNIYDGDPILVIKASRRGRQKYDNILKEVILKNIEYQEWCKILGVDYQEFIRKYLTL